MARTDSGFMFYDTAGRIFNVTPAKVQAVVKKHNLSKRRIYGCMAVCSDAWIKAAQSEGLTLAPGVTLEYRDGTD